MLPGYNRIFNAFGLQELERSIDIPDPNLGIGFAQTQTSIPVKLAYPMSQRMPVILGPATYEDTQVKGYANPVTLDMFPNTGFMGNALEGF